MRYTAIFQTSAGKLRTYIATASNDGHIAWKQLYAMKENDDECLILLVPGSHPVIRYEDVLEKNREIDLFSNL